MMLRILVCILLVPFYYCWGQSTVNVLPANTSSKPTILSIQYRIDNTDTLSIQPIADKQQGWQETSPNPLLVIGFTPHPVWLRITLRQATAKPTTYALQLTNFYADYVTLYQPGVGHKPWAVQYAGDMLPFAQREPKTRYPSFYVSGLDTIPQTLYMRILSTQHQDYYVRAWTRSAFDQQVLPDKILYLFLGVAVMLVLFHLALLLFMFRYVVFRSYAFFCLISILIAIFSANNLWLLLPHSPYWINTGLSASVALFIPALSYYVIQVFDLAHYSRRFAQVYWVCSVCSVIYAGLGFLFRHAYLTWAFVGLLFFVLAFSTLLIPFLYWRGIRPVTWNILSLGFVLLPYTYHYARNVGLISGTIQEDRMQIMFGLSIFLEPLFVAAMLWQASRDQVRIRENLSLEQANRENLLALNQVKTDFFTNISHEFRTPLTLILSPLEDLRQRFPTDTVFVLMHRNAQRLLSLTNQLLDLAKLDTGLLQINPKPGDLANDMHVWTAAFESQALERSIDLALDQNHTQWVASYDADKVSQVMVNLIANALKFTPAGGSIRIQAVYERQRVNIQISDTGIGLAPDALPHIFDRFYQAKPAQQYAGLGPSEGNGIGLALVKELVGLMNGTIFVTSQPGQGTTFTLSLPIPVAHEPIPRSKITEGYTTSLKLPNSIAEVATSGQPLSLDDQETNNLKKPLVLVVEDNADLRKYIRLVLAATYQIIEAANGLQGLERALENSPDLIITDLMMPQLDGLELCRALRADLRTNHIPVVMLTAKATIENRLEGLETGADDYLTKPFVTTELRLRLQNLLRRQEAIRAYCQRSLVPLAEPIDQIDKLASPQMTFVQGIYTLLDTYIDQANFDVEALAQQLAMSSRNLNRKLQAVVGLSARELIRSHRLRRGAELLQSGVSPTEVAYQIGFSSLSAFSRAFKEQFGHPPSFLGDETKSQRQ